jgi:hypothetical protein
MPKITKDVLVRAAKTFVQAGLATWALSNYDFSKGAIVGAVAAGISAVWNVFVKTV